MTKKNNSRAVGHAYERAIRLELIKLGWDKCQTSRYASRETDDANVDFVNTFPIQFQAKRWKSAPSYHEVLDSMPQNECYNVILHKRPNRGEVAILSKSDFFELLGMLKSNGII